jgi:hypothetical protein
LRHILHRDRQDICGAIQAAPDNALIVEGIEYEDSIQSDRFQRY